MICAFCGEHFEVNKKGRKRTHCGKIECKKKANSLSQHKYLQKKKLASQKETVEPEEPKIIKKHFASTEEISDYAEVKEQENEIVYSEAERAEDQLALPDMSDLIEISRRLGALRLEIIDIYRKSNEGVSRTSRKEQELLHQIERMKYVTSDSASKIMVEIKKNREERRTYKNRGYIAKTLLDNLPMTNPPEFTRGAIKRQKEQEELEVEEKDSEL